MIQRAVVRRAATALNAFAVAVVTLIVAVMSAADSARRVRRVVMMIAECVRTVHSTENKSQTNARRGDDKHGADRSNAYDTNNTSGGARDDHRSHTNAVVARVNHVTRERSDMRTAEREQRCECTCM